MKRRAFFKLALGAAAAVSLGLRATFSAPPAFESAPLLFSPTEYVGEWVWLNVPCDVDARGFFSVVFPTSESAPFPEGNDKANLAASNPAQS